MLWACKQLITPLRYLEIQQGPSLLESKKVFDWILPIILMPPATYLALEYSSSGVFTEKGLVGGFQKLLEIMVPFYIAALTAVAAFGSPALSEELKGHKAYLTLIKSDGTEVIRSLTRRQYVCYLFGYLALLSLALFVGILLLGMIGQKVGHDILQALGTYALIARATMCAFFVFWILQLLILTLWGVYFLADRLQFMDDKDL